MRRRFEDSALNINPPHIRLSQGACQHQMHSTKVRLARYIY